MPLLDGGGLATDALSEADVEKNSSESSCDRGEEVEFNGDAAVEELCQVVELEAIMIIQD